jgi:glucose/mannose transport system permease protein
MTVTYSFTSSRMLPATNWVGRLGHERLWSSDRWIISIKNLAIWRHLLLIPTLVTALPLVACLDRGIRL